MTKDEKLDFFALKDALSQLVKAHKFSISPMAIKDTELFEQFRNSSVQCFEFTFELATKFIKRKLEQIVSNPESVDQLDFKELIREAAIAGLIEDPEKWFNFRKLRNLSSHTYDKTKAELVYQSVKDLINAVGKLLAELENRNK